MYTLMIREYRIEKRWSQKKLALKSGLSQSEISYIENLEKSPSVYTIGRIGMAFGICPHALVKYSFPYNCDRNCIK